MVLMRQSPKGFSYGSSFSYGMTLSDDILVDECIAAGNAAKRADDITQYSMSHGKGYILVYKNDSQDKILFETINFDI